MSPAFEAKVLTSGLPGKYQSLCFRKYCLLAQSFTESFTLDQVRLLKDDRPKQDQVALQSAKRVSLAERLKFFPGRRDKESRIALLHVLTLLVKLFDKPILFPDQG